MPRHRSTPFLASALAALALILAPMPSATAEIEDISFPDEVDSEAGPLRLFGLGLLRYRVLFRGYVGGLYLPDGVEPAALFDDLPKALELYYYWDIEGRFFGEAADDILSRALPAERVTALRSRVDRLHALYRDVEEGDRYRLTYSPGVGTTLALNGEVLGTIPGADFAADYFGIWLGSEPLNVPFRDQMLGGISRPGR